MATTNTPAPDPAVTEAITAELSDHIEAQRREYGQYVAAGPIYMGTALAYNPGDAIPVSNVERWKYLESGQAIKVGSKEHKALRENLGLPPLES